MFLEDFRNDDHTCIIYISTRMSGWAETGSIAPTTTKEFEKITSILHQLSYELTRVVSHIVASIVCVCVRGKPGYRWRNFSQANQMKRNRFGSSYQQCTAYGKFLPFSPSFRWSDSTTSRTTEKCRSAQKLALRYCSTLHVHTDHALSPSSVSAPDKHHKPSHQCWWVLFFSCSQYPYYISLHACRCRSRSNFHNARWFRQT